MFCLKSSSTSSHTLSPKMLNLDICHLPKIIGWRATVCNIKTIYYFASKSQIKCWYDVHDVIISMKLHAVFVLSVYADYTFFFSFIKDVTANANISTIWYCGILSASLDILYRISSLIHIIVFCLIYPSWSWNIFLYHLYTVQVYACAPLISKFPILNVIPYKIPFSRF